MIFSPLKPIFPLETKKVALYAPEQNVPHIQFSGSVYLYVCIVLCIMYAIHAVANAANSLTIEKHPRPQVLSCH